MMSRKKYAITLLLLLMGLVAMAQDTIRMRSCRMGKVPEHVLLRRSLRATGNPYVGDRRQLVVLAAFADQQFKASNPLLLWHKIFNQERFDEAPFHGSVHDYFYDQSGGKFRLTFDLHYVRLADNRSKYRSTEQDDENSKYLVNDLLDSLVNRGGIDWEPYDWDGDGYIDQLLIVFAGRGMNAGGGTNSVWPHQWWLSAHWDSEARTVSSAGKDYTIDAYCCVQELYLQDTYGSFGTICHEYSHCMGLPDFYYGSRVVVGGWDIMDSGDKNGAGFCPAGYSSHERMLMGWMDIPEITSPTTITGMMALGEEPQSYMLRNDAYSNEYYILENRQKTGWDEKLPGSGLIIFHIDYDPKVWRGARSNLTPNTSQKQCYTLFHANNKNNTYYEAGWAYPYLSNDSLTNTSSPVAVLAHPNTDGTTLMSKPITNISVTNGLISFDVMGGDAQTDIASPSPDASLPVTIYAPDGTPRSQLSHGVNIVKQGGKVSKIYQK